MATVKLGIKGKSIPEKLIKAQTVITQSTNNANLPDANPPTVVALNAKRYTLQVTAANVSGAKSGLNAAVAAQDAAEADFDKAFSEHGAYVQHGTQGSAPGITSTGLDVGDDSGGPIVALAPANYVVTLGDEEKELCPDWDGQRGVGNWETQWTTDLTGATGWGNAVMSTKSQVDVKNFPTSGVEVLLRTRGHTASGPGPWSQNVKRRVP